MNKSFFNYSLAALLICSTLSLVIGPPAHAATTAGFKAGNIIDDIVFTNSNTMSVTQIQAFLNSKVSTCDTNGTQPASEFGRSDLTHAQYAALQGWQAPPYTCLRNLNENNVSSAQIIYNVSQQYKINPQVLIVLLQKESSLVTDTWPLNSQYKAATGYGCPDSGTNYSANCDAQYFGFTNQITWSAKMFRAIMNASPTWYTPYIVGNNYIQYRPDPSCGGSVVNIVNRATQALYNYTPYQPNTAALNAGYGSAEPCGAYGNRNFYLYFSDWFGSTIGAYYAGVDYSPTYDTSYYLANNPDVQQATGGDAYGAFNHFVNYGMKEGRLSSPNFSIIAYKNANPDLRAIYGSNLPAYFTHYALYGKNEGRIATGSPPIQYLTRYGGIDYSSVYNFNDYTNLNTDIAQVYINNDTGALQHFVTQGMMEGRQASQNFNVLSYRSMYYDLRRVFGTNLKLYYSHYMNYGRNEGRAGIGATLGGTSTANGSNYSSVYSFNTYETTYADMKAVFGLDDIGALNHFINYGMAEGRQATPEFNVYVYKNRYPDLQSTFGNNLKLYYLHYQNYGKSEGRTAS